MSLLFSRRSLLALGATLALPAVAAEASRREFEVVTTGLRFPESPVPMPDGSVMVVEIAAGRITRVEPDGHKEIVAVLGGGPNGAVVGPDGYLYVANNGGFAWHEADGHLFPAGQARDYVGGSIQRVDLRTGGHETLLREVGGHRLSAPNDLVFDADGAIWFNDYGQVRDRTEDRGGLYYCAPGHHEARAAVYPLYTPNGIALSRDGRTLYLTSTLTRMVFAFDLLGPARVGPLDGSFPGRLVASLGGLDFLDSMTIDAEGNLLIATVVSGGLLALSPTGTVLRRMALPDPLATSVRLGGAERRTAFVTLGTTGQLLRLPWPAIPAVAS